ncbi:MAG: malate dehydrogenase [Candidatus Omnitrophica bacterium]|nr:malate dehydrogenase [Candidatus Omnitrophota bacterium]MBU4487562.1 malate dehydrogenase [Candidatus Omnitrophota bacterium]MCG2705802.1 malate dehydrogenase [Candidatus Omnitrophota bacterium]
MKTEKVSIIGAGNVGALLALRIVEHDLADVVLVDIDEGIAKAKAYDLADASAIMGYEKKVEGTADYSKISDSSIVVITAGFPRRPGMSREDLIQKNGAVVREVALNIKKFASDAVVIVVTNPLDIMTYLTYNISGFDHKKVIGMAGVLDSARQSNLISEELNIMKTEVDSVIIGSHDDNMVPLLNYSKAQGMPLKKVADENKINEIMEGAKKRGAEIVSLLKSGSAFFAPSAGCFYMVKCILNNEHLTMCASVYLNGEYGLREICIGVPIVLGKNGTEKIIQLDLDTDEREKFQKAAGLIKSAIEKLNF